MMPRHTLRVAAPLLLLALGAPAWGADPTEPPELCRDDRSTCREDCSLQFGTVAGQRPKLLRCLEFCESAHQACEERYFEAFRRMEEQKKLAEKNKPDLALPRTRLPDEPGQRPAMTATTPSSGNVAAGDKAASAGSPGGAPPAGAEPVQPPPTPTRYSPIPTEASSFSSADEVEKLQTTPTKPKQGKKGPTSGPAGAPAPATDLGSWDPTRP